MSLDQTLEETEVQTFTYLGNKFKPYSVCHLNIAKDDVNNFIITWTRRTRLGGDWRASVEVLLIEDKEQYLIEILDNNNTIKRILEVNNTTTTTYTTQQQLIDFGTIQNNIKIIVYQMNSIIGKGYGKIVDS